MKKKRFIFCRYDKLKEENTIQTMNHPELPKEHMFICLKFGVKYKSIQIDRSDPNALNLLKKDAEDMVSKSIDNFEANNNHHHIQLFLISPDHKIPSLTLVKRASDLTPTCFIEIIIWRSDQENLIPSREHKLVERTYRKPTYCSYCDYFMWGLIKQVLLIFFSQIKKRIFNN